MDYPQIAILGLMFVAVSAGAFFVMSLFSRSPTADRLHALGAGKASSAPGAEAWIERTVQLTRPFAKLSTPEDSEHMSALRTRFLHAGIRHASAPLAYFGIKTVLALGLPLLAYFTVLISTPELEFQGTLLVVLVAAAFGYYLPNLVLNRLIFVRQREIFETFPDALDLMTVCVEAGLGVEAALVRVADEMQHKSEALAEELHLVTLELRAGLERARALRNLATRTGIDEVDGFVAMIIQAERFGTSIAASLRIHSDMLRTRRRQRAEEAAAKIALKLLFPLIFFIFPSLMLVLLGPAMIQIYRILLPTMAGGGG
ncbi:type II secretion system F family protein [Aromatoleum bremense]|uniref:Type II secretion system F family protein n=1 Tax=Aromatoleum bremense TaxID=76115 RepID=A0ABX1NSR0_9RHOO|nr:type II secretion system F family protein [Aromatoleum bremense]NMG15040.1 type II secretion system F family protein [Aromatoleum bremense]QTQ32252.1 Type II secretion system F domain-containing protein [Aromatoleum bremense]